AALDGRLARVETRLDPTFRVAVPTSCPDVPDGFLDPRATWADPAAYDAQAQRLARMFADNFVAFSDGADPAVREAGPVVSGWAQPGAPAPADTRAGCAHGA